MDGLIEGYEQVLAISESSSVERDTRFDLEVELMTTLNEAKARFTSAYDQLESKNGAEPMVRVQNDLVGILWCYGQLTKPPKDMSKDDPVYLEAKTHRDETEKALRWIIFDEQNPDSWVNVKGKARAEKLGQELYGVVSTLAFIRLIERNCPNLVEDVRPSQILASVEEDTRHKIDIKFSRDGTVYLFQLKSGNKFEIEPIPLEPQSGTFSSSSIVKNEDVGLIRKYGRSLVQPGGYQDAKMYAIRVPSLVNGQVRAVNVFGGIKDPELEKSFKQSAVESGLVNNF